MAALIELATKLTEKRLRAALPPHVIERAEYELGVIDSMGFNGYFLIIHDFINWGKDQGIIFGPGRGSAAGSIIAYSLNITDLDPSHTICYLNGFEPRSYLNARHRY